MMDKSRLRVVCMDWLNSKFIHIKNMINNAGLAAIDWVSQKYHIKFEHERVDADREQVA